MIKTIERTDVVYQICCDRCRKSNGKVSQEKDGLIEDLRNNKWFIYMDKDADGELKVGALCSGCKDEVLIGWLKTSSSLLFQEF